jgi:hypothetical protein
MSLALWDLGRSFWLQETASPSADMISYIHTYTLEYRSLRDEIYWNFVEYIPQVAHGAQSQQIQQ